MASVRVAPEVAMDWERGEGEVRLVLRSDSDLATSFAAMRSASDAVRSSFVIEMWEPTVLPFGVGLFVVMDSPQYDGVIDGLVSHLEAMGISGVLASRAPRTNEPYPLEDAKLAGTVELISGRVSLVGESSWPSPPHGWRVADGVVPELVVAAVRWCHDGDALRALFYGSADFAVVVDGDEAVRLLSLQLQHEPFEERTLSRQESTGTVRQVDFGLSFGYVAFTSMTGTAMGDGWRGHVDAIRTGLKDVAGLARYAMVRRGTSLNALASPRALAQDWVAMPHITNPRRLKLAMSVEDHRVPDAFGIQLLGPGHAYGIPRSGGWRRTPLVEDRVLLEHPDLAAWYAQPRPDEATLQAAREDLSVLLVDDAVLRR